MNAANAAARKGEAQERRVLTRQEAGLNAANAAARKGEAQERRVLRRTPALRDLTAGLFDARHSRRPTRWDQHDRGSFPIAL